MKFTIENIEINYPTTFRITSKTRAVFFVANIHFISTCGDAQLTLKIRSGPDYDKKLKAAIDAARDHKVFTISGIDLTDL